MNRADEILHVAHELLVERGYNGFSYADIADKVGIQKASIHYHFPSKENLVQSVIQRYRSIVKSKLSELDKIPVDSVQKLRLYLNYWNECLQNKASDVCLCAQLAAEVPMLPESVRIEVQGHFEELSGWIAGLLREAIDKRQLSLSADQVKDEAEFVVASIHGGMLSARTYNNGEYFNQISKQLLIKIEAAS
ncbi:TetR/AcrR family transcriptional regulator [Paenibacillus glycanilyticus]|uniref:TetR/AcrR family transcriptional regulator n=1 Tax=Paenibacillus glycanilyticus TaxID=126569 RepID=UPI00203C155E|nr:TetR/AcrR family transcriptional regulator [Paenibacillus glycanilyticus]MCM3629463.1 TetR/AcrR family transcriptional regulator [Paenibacillus glycanilyticus]